MGRIPLGCSSLSTSNTSTSSLGRCTIPVMLRSRTRLTSSDERRGTRVRTRKFSQSESLRLRMEVEGEELASCRDVQLLWTRLLRWVSSDSERAPKYQCRPANYLTSTRGEYSSVARLAEPSTIVKYFEKIATSDDVLTLPRALYTLLAG